MIQEYATHHHSFTIERTFNAPPQAVFGAFADPAAKARWFAAPDERWTQIERAFDFRVGGTERLKGRWGDGTVSDFHSIYFDIVPNERIVYSYDMLIDEKRISVSLATIELYATGNGTRMTFTEQNVHLDGYPTPEDREAGTAGLLDALVAYVDGTTVRA